MATAQPTIHFALTSHGLGHLTRAQPTIRALRAALPSHSIIVSIDVDADWIRGDLRDGIVWRKQDYEPGAIQRNCFEVDVSVSLRAARSAALRVVMK